MAVLPDFDALSAALEAALDSEDMVAANALLDAHDRALRDTAAQLSADKPDDRQLLIELQRRQVALIECVRQRRDALGDRLHDLSLGQQATRAYREQEGPR